MSSSQTSSSSSSHAASPPPPAALQPATAPAPPGPLAQLFDIECDVDFVIGTGRLKVSACLRLARQSIVRLDQSGGADLELRVHGVTVAIGEVVIMDDVTALRVTRIVSPAGPEAA